MQGGILIQQKIIKPANLLDSNGELTQKGYATSLLLKYNRNDVASKLKLKEWDYYLIYQDNDFGVALTVGKNSCLGMFSATFIDFESVTEKTKTIIAPVPFGRMTMPESSCTGYIHYHNKKVSVTFRHENGVRKLHMYMKNFNGDSDFEATIDLYNEPADSMVIATPFKESVKDFYYNQKIIGMKASGSVLYNNEIYKFYNSYGLLDWGRGVWPRNVIWHWGAGQGVVNDKVFGFNLGYGFGDTSAATENMLFYNGIASKLEGVTFRIPKNDQDQYEYMKPWTVTSSDRRFEADFTPVIDRNAAVSSPILSTDQHQVFGRFNGQAVLDDGTVITMNDFPGFIERVINKW